MKPPYNISPKILQYCTEIGRLIGQHEGLMHPAPQPMLRKQNRIKSIQGSLAIEGNTLSLDQISAILDNKRVIGPPKEILEVKNAIKAYEQIGDYKIYSAPSLLQAHKILMKDLIPDAGHWRQGGVGVLEGSRVVHVAPPAKRVPDLMADLFNYLKSEPKNNALISSCVFHHELEFIHPFSDGNGRIGRLWHHAILLNYHPLFEYIPIELVIKDHQQKYYDALGTSQNEGDATIFIDFCLSAILDGLSNFLKELKPEPHTAQSRLQLAESHFGKKWFSRKDYIAFFKTISTATASRDLQQGSVNKQLQKEGDKALAQYRFI